MPIKKIALFSLLISSLLLGMQQNSNENAENTSSQKEIIDSVVDFSSLEQLDVKSTITLLNGDRMHLAYDPIESMMYVVTSTAYMQSLSSTGFPLKLNGIKDVVTVGMVADLESVFGLLKATVHKKYDHALFFIHENDTWISNGLYLSDEEIQNIEMARTSSKKLVASILVKKRDTQEFSKRYALIEKEKLTFIRFW